MKILNLKFKNINSLAGEWSIDFTAPQFTENGLFAIMGKTGAGKSSILDAIALALYGKTPRVDVTGSNNDVMTRGEKDCYAEITFEINGKCWFATWKQERSRTGILKQVERAIADEKGLIVADKLKECDKKIFDILRLTFEQFTKVVMLAQGSFAAFLQADKNDKGELLERITGTEIYGEISKKVFERCKNEKNKLDKILIELGAIKILPDKEINNLQKEISDSLKQKELIDNELQNIEKGKKWIADLTQLQKQIVESKQKLPVLQQNLETAKVVFEQSFIALQAAKKSKEEGDKILVKVRELDTKIDGNAKVLSPVLSAIKDLDKSKNNIALKIENLQEALSAKKGILQKTQDWLNKNVKYESLVSKYTAIENQNLLVDNLLIDFNAKKIIFEKAKTDLMAKISLFNKSKDIFVEKEKLLSKKLQEFETKKATLSTILADKELTEYQSEKENIIQFGIYIKNLISVENGIADNQKEIQKFTETISADEKQEKELAATISCNKATAENLTRQIKLLDENIKLARTIQSLDEHRKSLEDHKPCPLCGATEHPFARGNEPKIGEKEQELKSLNSNLEKNQKTIRQVEKMLAKLSSDKENALINKEKEIKKLSDNNDKRTAFLNDVFILNPDFSIPKDENTLVFLTKIYYQKQEEYKAISVLILKATEIENQIKNLQNIEIPALLQEKETAVKFKTDADTAQKLAAQQVEIQKDLTMQAKTKHETANADLHKFFAEYEVSNLENLKKCLNSWILNKKQNEDLTAEIIEINSNISLKNNELENINKVFSEKQGEKQRYESEKQALLANRKELFADKRVEDEDARLKKLLENAEKMQTEAEKMQTKANTELEKNQAVIIEKEKDFSTKQVEKVTEKSLEELQIEYNKKKPLSDEFSQKIGAIHQTIAANNENLEKNSKKLKEKELQQKIYDKWKILDNLIGSQDGKKYRNFAQALTFEHLIILANRQLIKMSERYILKRVDDAVNPFELLVIDKFQNCDERTVQNLSGGEKFIVSLSLALGLANMASRNMRIDTMFIDEGFGTLDTDYLDTALNVLQNLQGEGKLIGVISHLSELKERIITHIEVILKNNGHSKIEICG